MATMEQTRDAVQLPAVGRKLLFWMASASCLLLVGCGGADEKADVASSQASKARRASVVSAQAVSAATTASTSETIYSESGKLIRGDQNMAAVGNDLFGDRVSLSNGSLEFVQSDINVPGNGLLPVSVARRLVTGQSVVVRGHFGDWDLEIPRVHGVFANSTGWKVGGGVATASTARCSQFGPPPQVYGQSNQGLFNPVEYWHGHFLYVPGAGSQEILRASTSPLAVNPTGDLAAYPMKLTTRDRWTVICGTTLQNGPGEGFTAVSPDGTRYRFDWMASRIYPQIEKALFAPPQESLTASAEADAPLRGASSGQRASPTGQDLYAGYLLKRVEVWIMPTLVTDRFGNTVSYTYDAVQPWRVMRIQSATKGGSEPPRIVEFGYNASGQIATATHDGRQWVYGYADHQVPGGTLTSVTLPLGGGAWSLAMSDIARPPDFGSSGGGTCDAVVVSGLAPGIGQMVHPSGATGYFRMAPVLRGRSYVERACMGNDYDQSGWSLYPVFTNSYALQSKTIGGPGLPAAAAASPTPGSHTWTYDYGSANGSFSPCVGCPETTTTTITDPRQVKTRHIFGNRFRETEGQLLKVEEDWAEGRQPLRVVERWYRQPKQGPHPYPDPIGTSIQMRTAGDLSTRYAPERERVTTQQEATFTWRANEFDRLARPVNITRESSLGYSRTERTIYPETDVPADARFTDKWVLGQARASYWLNPDTGVFEATESHDFHSDSLNRWRTWRFGQLKQTRTYYEDGSMRTLADGAGKTSVFGAYKRGLAQSVTHADGNSRRWTRSSRRSACVKPSHARRQTWPG